MQLKPLDLTARTFRPFGVVMEAARDGFQVCVAVPRANGWQVALNRVVMTVTDRVHRHTNTKECFGPLSGAPLIVVAPHDDPKAVRAFRLTRPVCLDEGIWHTTLTATGTSTVMVCESADVVGEEHVLGFEITVTERDTE